MPEFEIRPIRREDYDEWLSLWQGPESYLDFYGATVPQHVTDVVFEKFLNSDEKYWAAVAVKDGEIIGFVTYVHNAYTWFEEGRIFLNDLFVKNGRRVKGVGRALIEYVYEDADKMKIPNVFWSTQFENHRAQILYTKLAKTGFALYKRQL